MKNLRVGMRVRILYSLCWPELIGEEGVIIEPSDDGGITGRSEWMVAPDRWGSFKAPYKSRIGGQYFAPCSESLEPLYDGNETVSWQSCAWKPEGVTT